ncbi:DUF3177 family protein [Oscillatoria sp. CS-180]|uniref:DUF3177 family protein n=1 Tax=Oscillatoria sp. CS-180 TaxID=3021720 RepID=UPI00232BB653|nr:DUF3177 family protein [Oscillatoria sp. CS-180]MDB9526793.1 DUF3177 family protein [Oscillatoria sp. CS-180]
MTTELANVWTLEKFVWADYRLAVLFTVLVPLVLTVWAFVTKSPGIQMLLTIYWRVASLLMITVYLMIGGLTFSFISGLMARVLIPVSLWFWEDLNEEIQEQPNSPLRFVFVAWRWAVTVYSAAGAVLIAFFLPCAFSRARFAGEACQVWLKPPLLYKEILHGGYTHSFLAFFGVVGLIVYLLALGYFVFVRLGRQGRSAMN